MKLAFQDFGFIASYQNSVLKTLSLILLMCPQNIKKRKANEIKLIAEN
jgi:hypothetical protein